MGTHGDTIRSRPHTVMSYCVVMARPRALAFIRHAPGSVPARAQDACSCARGCMCGCGCRGSDDLALLVRLAPHAQDAQHDADQTAGRDVPATSTWPRVRRPRLVHWRAGEDHAPLARERAVTTARGGGRGARRVAMGQQQCHTGGRTLLQSHAPKGQDLPVVIHEEHDAAGMGPAGSATWT